MKKRVTRKLTRRAVARGTTRRANPRYRVILDGYDWASIPAFNKVEAVKRAKEIYPDKKGKWTAELVDEEMYKNMRGGADYEAKIRLERKKARAAERATAPPSRARARRNGTHIHADMIDHLDVAKVHNPEINSVDDVWEAISGERVISQSRIAPYGNYSSGLILEEYALSDGTYLQVALDPSIGNDPVEWAHTEESADDWLVG